MASGTISGGNYNSIYSYYMTWTSVSNGSAANTSNVTLNWIYKKNANDPYGAYNTGGSSKVTLVINGTSSGQMRADFDLRSAAVGTTKAIATFTVNNIPHNSDGTCTINVSGTHVPGNSWSTKSIGNTAITLDTIPRYATCNISLDNEYTDETAISVDWTSDSLIDRIWYSTDNGSTWLPNGGWSENASSGGIIIGALNPGTSYPIKIRVRRKDSQLLTDSAKSDFSTLSYPYVSKVGTTALTIGTQQTLTLYNPKSRSVTVYMKQNNTSGTQIYSGSSSTTSKQFTPDATTMYNLIPNAKSGNCVYYVTYKDSSNVTHTSATKSGTFVVNENNNRPSVSSSSAYDNNDTTYNLTRNRNKIVLNASNLALTISATAQNKATFNNGGYIKVNGTALSLTISGSTATGVYNFNKPTTANYSVELKDSRGIITPNTSYTISSYVSYIVPSIIGTAVRNQPTDGKVNINGNGNFFNGSFGNTSNTLTATYTVKEKSTSTVLETGSMTVTKSGNTYTLAQKQVSNADYTKEYVATITVTDQLNTVTTNINIPKGQPVFWWNGDSFNVKTNLKVTGATMLYDGDLQLRTPNSSSDDSRDIIFVYGNGNEKARLWCNNNPASTNADLRLQYKAKNSSGTDLISDGVQLQNDFKLEKHDVSVTVPGNSFNSYNLDAVTIPSGYTLVGVIPRINGYGDQWLVSLSYYSNKVVAMIYSKHSSSLTSTISYYLLFVRNNWFTS